MSEASSRFKASHQRDVAQLFERLGAAPEAAERMSAQLLKRAGQVAAERECPPEQALRELLEKAVRGRMGLGTPERPGRGETDHAC